jgi:hypothetical protein
LFNLDVYSITNPFWDIEVDNLKNIGVVTESEYPACRINFNDSNYHTITNYGDTQTGSTGIVYYIYIAENKKIIRDRLSNDHIIYHDIEIFNESLIEVNSKIIEASSNLIKSLEGIPGTIFSFIKRHKRWKLMKNIPIYLLNIESFIPKYEIFCILFKKFIEERCSYINVPRIMWFNGEVTDEKHLVQRPIPHFFSLTYDAGNLKIDDSKPIKPKYSAWLDDINNNFNELNKNTIRGVSNLKDASSLYSSNFGFDAVWVAIIAIIISILSNIPLYKIGIYIWHKLEIISKIIF